MPFVSGEVGPCKWSVIRGTPTTADLAGFVAHIGRLTARKGERVVVLDLAHDITLPTSIQRKIITDAVEALPDKQLVVAHALVTNSAAARGVLTAINWFVKNRPFDERVFSRPGDALSWLAEELPSVEPDVVLQSISDEAPAFSHLRW